MHLLIALITALLASAFGLIIIFKKLSDDDAYGFPTESVDSRLEDQEFEGIGHTGRESSLAKHDRSRQKTDRDDVG